MKISQSTKPAKKLGLKTMRYIERALGVYLDAPLSMTRCGTQQIGVYDEDEKHAGDIAASSLYFTEDELLEKIKTLFEGQPPATPDK